MGQAPRDDVKAVSEVEREVDELRERTTSLLEELERRIREGVDQARGTVARVKNAVDVKRQLKRIPAGIKRRPVLASGIGVGTAAAIGLGVWIAVRRRHEARRPMARLKRRAQAYRALITEPRRATHERLPIWRRVLTAVLAAAAATLARKLIETGYQRLQEQRRLAEPAPALGV
jgi:hypothetical protein